MTTEVVKPLIIVWSALVTTNEQLILQNKCKNANIC